MSRRYFAGETSTDAISRYRGSSIHSLHARSPSLPSCGCPPHRFFKRVTVGKPKASRNSSLEAFVVCEGYSPPASHLPNLRVPIPMYSFGDAPVRTPSNNWTDFKSSLTPSSSSSSSSLSSSSSSSSSRSTSAPAPPNDIAAVMQHRLCPLPVLVHCTNSGTALSTNSTLTTSAQQANLQNTPLTVHVPFISCRSSSSSREESHHQKKSSDSSTSSYRPLHVEWYDSDQSYPLTAGGLQQTTSGLLTASASNTSKSTSTYKYTYHPPVAPPIAPPYQTALMLKRSNQLNTTTTPATPLPTATAPTLTHTAPSAVSSTTTST